VTDLVWSPDSTTLVVITRVNGTPGRSRLLLLRPDRSAQSGDGPDAATELVVIPAEILSTSSMIDPFGRWLAFLAQVPTSASATGAVSLCVVELRQGGQFRDLADLGLRPSAVTTGLFVVDLSTAGVTTQPRRIGTITGLAAPVWRNESTIYGFGRRDDGALRLQAVEHGTVIDTGGRIKPGAVQGTGLAARWDVEHARVLLLTRPAASATGLRAWRVSFLPKAQVRP
jgi:hypothetical protein